MCHIWATFFLEWHKEKCIAILKSLKHVHMMEETSYDVALRAVGMLPLEAVY